MLRLGGVMVVLLFLSIISIGGFFVSTARNANSNKALSLQDVLSFDDERLELTADGKLIVNGDIKTNGVFILEASQEPMHSEQGTLYFDAVSKQLRYYDGTVFHSLSPKTDILAQFERLQGQIQSLEAQENASSAASPSVVATSSNATTLDNLDSTAFLKVNDALNAQTLGGLDSSAFIQYSSGNNLNLSIGSLQTGGITRITNAGVLQNITSADAGAFFTGGVLSVARGGTGLNAYSAGDLVYGDAVDSLGRLAIGATNQCLIVSGGVPAWGSCTAGGAISGSGTLNAIPLFTPDGGTLGDSVLTQSGTDVTAAGKLIVDGGPGTATVAANYLYFSRPGVNSIIATDSTGSLQLGTVNTPNVFVIEDDEDIAIDTNSLFVDISANRVGIGTAAPGSILEVSAGTSAESAHFTRESGNLAVRVGRPGVGSNANGVIYWNDSAKQLQFFISGDVQGSSLNVANGGNVGVGDTSPAYLLTVGNGDIFGVSSDATLVWEGDTADEFETSLLVVDPTADITYRLPDATAGTYDICTSANNCVGSGIGGSGTVDTIALFTPDGNSIGNSVITQSSGNIVVAGNLTVSTDNSLILAGGATLPGSPAEGQIFYDSTRQEVLIYTDDGADARWEQLNGNSGATFVVGTTAGGAISPTLADYQADGEAVAGAGTIDGDQVEINAAIAAANAVGGGTVYLMEGTYEIDDSIIMDSNVTLVGAGSEATTIVITDGTDPSSTLDIITNSGIDTYMEIRNMKLDVNGNGNSGTAEVNGIDIAASGQTGLLPGVVIDNIVLLDTELDGIRIAGSLSEVRNVFLDCNNSNIVGEYGVITTNGGRNKLTDSYIYDCGAINISGGLIANNVINDSGASNGAVSIGSYGTISGNVIDDAPGHGITTGVSSNYVSIIGNTISDSVGAGMYPQGDSASIIGNVIENTGSHGIRGSAARDSTISNNTITDTDSAALYLGSGSVADGNTIFTTASGGHGISVLNASNAVISNNYISTATASGVRLDGTDSYITIDGNQFYDVGDTSSKYGVDFTVSGTKTNNQVVGNSFVKTSGNGSGILINDDDDYNYLADNTFSGTFDYEINDLSSTTRYASQAVAGATLRSGSSLLQSYGSATLTGTADPTASTTLNGTSSSTLFTKELQVGDRITVNGETRTVVSIVDDDTLTVDSAFTDTADASVTRLPATLVVKDSSSNVDVVVSDQGFVGIGTASPGVKLDINSAADEVVLRLQDSTGTCDFNPDASGLTPSCSSDARLKSNITEASDALAYLQSLRIHDYTVNASGKRATGVIAQEALLTHPELVTMGDDGYYKVKEISSWTLIKAIQQLNQRFAGFEDGGLIARDLEVANTATVGALDVNGSVAIEHDLMVKGVVHVAELHVNGHITSEGDVPTVTAGGGASAGVAVVVDGTDTAGTIRLTAGDSPEDDQWVVGVDFVRAYNETPHVSLTPKNIQSAKAQPFVQVSAKGFYIYTVNSVEPGRIYEFDYLIIE